MSKEMNLLLAFIDAVGYDVKESGGNYTVNKRPKPAPVARTSQGLDYNEGFEILWSLYPKRLGNNSKSDALRAYNARIKEAKRLTDEHKLMLLGVNRYADFLDATGSIGTEFVMMASTFLGPSKKYMQDWEKPAIRADVIKLPGMDADLSSFAAQHALSSARAGENYPEYRKRLSAELSALNKEDKT